MVAEAKRFLKMYYHAFDLVLSLAYVIVTVIKMVSNKGGTVLSAVDYLLWAYFALVFARQLYLTENKVKYVTTHIFDLLALAPVKTFGFFRLFRFFRLFGVTVRIAQRFLTAGLRYVFYILAVVVVIATYLFHILEHQTLLNSVYWAVITISTVGYGDISPTTAIGKILSIVLAMGGVTLFGALTSSITSMFEEEKAVLQEQVGEMQQQLDRIEQLLNEKSKSE
jgi:voltage-gated potassium channel